MNKISFYSTNLKSPPLAFNEALLKGQAPDMGLYMPEEVTTVSTDEIEQMRTIEYH